MDNIEGRMARMGIDEGYGDDEEEWDNSEPMTERFDDVRDIITSIDVANFVRARPQAAAQLADAIRESDSYQTMRTLMNRRFPTSRENNIANFFVRGRLTADDLPALYELDISGFYPHMVVLGQFAGGYLRAVLWEITDMIK